MTNHPLYLLTYSRGLHWQTSLPKAHHWTFLIDLSPLPSIKHQLRGMPGAYYYPGPEPEEPSNTLPKNEVMEINVDTDGATARKLVKRMEIGWISDARLEWFEGVCRGVEVENREEYGGEGRWNCQSWCLGVLDELKREKEGVEIWYGGEEVRGWLKEE